MSISKEGSSFNSSAASWQIETSDDVAGTKVKNYVKDILKSRIFLGRYVERRLIDPRIGYRDIVLISAAEVELKRDMMETLHKLNTSCPSFSYVGIIEAESLGLNASGLCLWTEIDNQPFGPFWFQIRSIKFRGEEVMVSLKCLRHITDAYLEIEPLLTGNAKKIKAVSNPKSAMNPDSSVETLNDTYNEIVATLKSALTISNVKEFFTFVFAFIIAIFTGSTAFINFLGNFILALIREMSIFVKNSTPMFLGLLDFFSKIVGGFYILLAMLFKPSNPGPRDKRSIAYYNSQRTSEIYDDKQFD